MEMPFTKMRVRFRRINQELCIRCMRGCLTSKFLGEKGPLVDATGFYLVQGHVYIEVREQRNRRNKVPSE